MTFESVIHTFKSQADSWVERYGAVVKELGLKDLVSTKKVIEDFENVLD